MAVLNVIVKTTPIMQVRILLPPQAFMMVEEEIGTNFGEDILRMYGNIDIEKAKEYQDIVEEYYPIETIVYGIKNIKQEFIENGRKEIYKRTYKD